MVNIQKFGDSAIKFTFTDNDRYLYDGEITVPLNSLILVLDESDMAVFKKIDGDVFLTFLIENSNFSTKAELETFYKNNMVGSTGGGGGGGVSSGWVENYVEDALEPYAESSAVTEEISEAVSGKADTSYVQNIASNVATVSGDVNTLSGSVNTLTGNVNTISGDVANKADTTAVTASINAAVSGKQDTLVSGTNIKTINNESILGEGNIEIQGGGGKAIVAGRGIAVTTGETADTVSFNLPIWNPSGAHKNITIGSDTNHPNGMASVAVGQANTTNQRCSFVSGIYNILNNEVEVGVGQYNNSVSSSCPFGDSGNTLFSVGNGTANNARHNAFEIRQNGDIYITKDGADVLLQDELGGGGVDSGTVQSMIDDAVSTCASQADVDDINDELSAITATTDRIERVTATALNDLNAKLGGMKLVQLTQAQYNALTVKDPQTLYIITNVVN